MDSLHHRVQSLRLRSADWVRFLDLTPTFFFFARFCHTERGKKPLHAGVSDLAAMAAFSEIKLPGSSFFFSGGTKLLPYLAINTGRKPTSQMEVPRSASMPGPTPTATPVAPVHSPWADVCVSQAASSFGAIVAL